MFKLKRLRCSFCGKGEAEVSKLVAGPRVYICDECVAVARRLMEDAPDGDAPPPKVETTFRRKLSTRVRRLLRGDARRVGSTGVGFTISFRWKFSYFDANSVRAGRSEGLRSD